MTWGDAVGVPPIINAFVHLAGIDVLNLWLGFSIMALSAAAFAVMCLGSNHKPDYGFPDTGKISFAGFLHLFYFGFGTGAALLCLLALIRGELEGPVMWTALSGGTFYAGCFILEIASGNFDRLKKV